MTQQDVLACIEDEPELSDVMSEEMYQAMRTLDRDSMTEALRIIVRHTKEGIRQRVIERMELRAR